MIDINDIDFNHDKEKAIELYQVVDADSSQQDAILLSQKGASFVMQGPPGTGKSQTITNIIAQGLADGKKILFVSEKMAALEVVYKRLEEVHLADFCLALHSHKANKKEVLEQLGQNLNLRRIKVKDEEVVKLTEIDVLKEFLNTYVKDIHRVIMPIEMSLYEVYGAIAELGNMPDIPIKLDGIQYMTKDYVNRLSLMVSSLDKTRSVLGPQWYKNPWRNLEVDYLTISQKRELKDSLSLLNRLISGTVNLQVEGNPITNFVTLENIDRVIEVLRIAESSQNVPASWFERDISTEEYLVKLLKKLSDEILITKESINDIVTDDIWKYDVEEVLRNFEIYDQQIRKITKESVSLSSVYGDRENVWNGWKKYQENLLDVEKILRDLIDKFGVSITDTYQSLKWMLLICELLLERHSLTKAYFTEEGRSQIEQLLTEYEKEYLKSCEIKKEILNSYKEDILYDEEISKIRDFLKKEICLDKNSNVPKRENMQMIIEHANNTLNVAEKISSFPVVKEWMESLKISFPETIHETNEIIVGLQQGLNNQVYVKIWNNDFEREKAKQLLGEIKIKDNTLKSAKRSMQEIADSIGIRIDIETFSERDVSQLSKLSFVYGEPEKIIHICNNMVCYNTLENIERYQKHFAEECLKIEELNKQVHVRKGVSVCQMREILDANKLHFKVGICPDKWELGTKELSEGLLQTLMSCGKKLQELHSKIGEECEEAVFDLDYISILDRFKTEYTSIFKIFKKSYREDIKCIRRIYKTVKKKIPDAEIVSLLMQIKEYKECLQVYGGYSSKVSDELDIKEYDIWFNWNVLNEKIDAFEKINQLFESRKDTIKFLNNNGIDDYLRKSESWFEDKSWFDSNDDAKNLFGILYVGENTDTENIKKALSTAQDMLKYFSSNEKYIEYLLDKEKQSMSDSLIVQGQTILAERVWFENNGHDIEQYFDLSYVETYDEWNILENGIKTYEMLKEKFGGETAHQLLSDIQEKEKYIIELINKLTFFNSVEDIYREVFVLNGVSKDFYETNLDELFKKIHDRVELFCRIEEIYVYIDKFKNGKTEDNGIEGVISDIDKILFYQKYLEQTAETEEYNRNLIGEIFAKENTNWDEVQRSLRYAKKLMDIVEEKIGNGIQYIYDYAVGGKCILENVELCRVSKLMDELENYEKQRIYLQNNDISLNIGIARELMIILDKVINLVKEVNNFIKVELSYDELINVVKIVNDVQGKEQDLSINLGEAKQKIPFVEMKRETNWDNVLNVFSAINVLKSISNSGEFCPEFNLILTNKEKIQANIVLEVIEKINTHKDEFMSFVKLFDNEEVLRKNSLIKLQNRIQKCEELFETMDAWIDYRDSRKRCDENGLAEFITISEDIIYPEGALSQVFTKAFYYAWFEEISKEIVSVAKFNARIQNSNVENFRKLDTHQLPIAQMRIREKLINGMPDRTTFNRAGDEMSVLIHELGKKRKIMPLRKLFRSIPNLLLKLKPCLMMSPLSVSYFLEADTYKFDMVIFDEASQIFPQDAIGAIFRGAQVIIAGDSKQLPPTNFFAASTNNNSDYDVDNDDIDEIISDSILEEATNTIPNRSLLWHYRSRNEDLISFSNKEIYGNNLVTFPNSKVNERDSGVEYIYVPNGVYENRCNKEEATKCVALIEEHIKKHPERSLGIIAFSESQQSTIEDAVQEFRSKHRAYDAFFAEEKEEPFFVKNLENVQGDERDTIIFSICYGKNSQGKMYMRFGPLGHQGGERRLNVAITRAKYNVKLVGSILPGDIDLAKTKSDGVKMLRSYIEFASRKQGQVNSVGKKNRLYETDVFSEYVAKYLEEHGYKVKKNVGNSDYTVDIAIEHPEIAGCYVAGIECDGDSYQMARTVRDRDHLRTAVMERMGWKMYRVWSTEWVQNEQDAKKKLLTFINDAIKNYTSYEIKKEPEKEINVATEEVKQNMTSQKLGNKNNPYNLERYREGDWRNVKNFRAYDNESRIADRIHEVVRVEQPIHIELLYKRMASCFGNERVTNPIRYTVDVVMKQVMSEEIRIDNSQFVTLTTYNGITVRRSLPGSPDRNIEHIPQEEIKEAIKLVLDGAFGVEVPALILETARIFGFEKTGVKIRQFISKALDALEAESIVRISDERVQLLEER